MKGQEAAFIAWEETSVAEKSTLDKFPDRESFEEV